MKKLRWLVSGWGKRPRRSVGGRPGMAVERFEERCVLTSSTWAMALGGAGHDDPVGIAQTTDGGFVVVGNTESFNAQNGDIWANKFDRITCNEIAFNCSYSGR